MLFAAYGGAQHSPENGNDEFFIPTSAEVWAGFANENTYLYPFTFTYGGSVLFNAKSEFDTLVTFTFESNPYPYNNPNFQVYINVTASQNFVSYTADFASQGTDTFSSFVFAFSLRNETVYIENLYVTENVAPPSLPSPPYIPFYFNPNLPAPVVMSPSPPPGAPNPDLPAPVVASPPPPPGAPNPDLPAPVVASPPPPPGAPNPDLPAPVVASPPSPNPNLPAPVANSPPLQASTNGDPHLHFAHGGSAYFRGKHNRYFAILSFPGLSFSLKTVNTTFLLPTPQLVHGTFFVDAAFIVCPQPHSELNTSRMYIFASAKTPGFSVYIDDQMIYNTTSVWKRFVAYNASVLMKQSSLVVCVAEWEMTVTRKPIYNFISGPSRWRYDVSVKNLAGEYTVPPHGLLGQSFDNDTIAVSGRRDTYAGGAEVTTTSMAEGAIEGTADDYQLASKWSAKFTYTRFHSTNGTVRNISKLTGQKENVFQYVASSMS
jgi:hypothetical protein